MTTDPNKPAFPVPMARDCEGVNHFVTDYGEMGGMTYREYLVANIAAGLVSDTRTMHDFMDDSKTTGESLGEVVARAAIGQARCIIAALNAEGSR